MSPENREFLLQERWYWLYAERLRGEGHHAEAARQECRAREYGAHILGMPPEQVEALAREVAGADLRRVDALLDDAMRAAHKALSEEANHG